MDQNLDPNALPATPAPADAGAGASAPSPASAPVVSGPDPAYVAQLEAYVRQQQQELQRYEPVKEDVEWMLGDESRRESVRKYRAAYETASKPQRPPELEDLYRHIDESTAPARAWITKQEAAENARQAADRAKFESENMAYLNRLAAEQKYDNAKMTEIAAYADSMAARLGRNVGIEEAYKTLQSFGGKAATPKDAPVLRADSGAVGVPGNSTRTDKPWLKDFQGYVLDEARKAQRSA